jgi:hypothetical protein
MRASARVLAWFGLGEPDWTTGRTWLLRLGLYKLTRPKERADDWIWLVDHSVQIGPEKCLVVFGLRGRDQPPVGQCLRLEDCEPLEILPVRSSTKHEVAAQLEALTAQTGVPRAIVRDDGGDLRGGVALFRQNHPGTADLYDVKHKTACALRQLLEGEPRWTAFNRQAVRARSQVQQTAAAFLAPPRPRPKARYLNLAELVNWGQQTLRLVEAPSTAVLRHVEAPLLEAKLGWLRDYRAELMEWSELLRVARMTEDFLRRQGLFRGAADALAERGPGGRLTCERSQRLWEELLDHVAAQEEQVRPGERLPTSTEVLESSFGKWKRLEDDQSRSGFTGLLLGLGALVSQTTGEVVRAALESCPMKKVWNWCRSKLGESVQRKRRLAYPSGKAQQKPEEQKAPAS